MALQNFKPVEVVDGPGTLRVESDIPADLFNVVQETRLSLKNVDKTIEQVKNGAENRGVPFMWLLWPDDEPHDLMREALPDHGFHHDMTCLMMVHDLTDLGPVDLQEGSALVQITNENQLGEYSAVACSAFNWAKESWEMGREWNRHMMHHENGRKMFAVCEEGRMVAICGGKAVGKLYEVSVIATHKDVRNKGYGTAMTTHLCHEARRQGCEVAYLEATSMGAGVYSRIGFNAFDELEEYLFHPETVQ